MSILLRDLTHYLEQWAPLAYQESYDNAGLLVGAPDTPVTGVLVTLDATEAVIDEALAKGCNVIVAHHPIIFKGLKKINGKNYVERTVIKAIKNDIALYATHTNLDNVTGGVNFKIAEKLGLQNVRVLAPKSQVLTKLSVYVPTRATQTVLHALYDAGAGQLGQYEHVSFRMNGTGTFKPLAGARPAVGQVGRDEAVSEDRIEVLLPTHLESKLVAALRRAHPYEVPAYDLYALNNLNEEVGAGAIGDLPEAMGERPFLAHLKASMQVRLVRHTPLRERPVRRVAVCGGTGSFLLNDAVRNGADLFVTADYKYHEFFDADGRIVIADINHYESEAFTKELIHQRLSEKFNTFAVILSETVTNPVHYYF